MNDDRHIYDPAAIEPRWQAVWEERGVFRTSADPAELAARPKYYVLDMFPYPSGAGLHVGHPVGYTATDVVARLKRMQGHHVLHPMGWDAFGLPAERAAVREGLHPAAITRRNVDNFRRQIRRLGFSYDWRREIDTSAPGYHRWTQWIFLKLYERGLAYMAEMPVNWCPALGTVLANEEVEDGRYVETGDAVETRLMRQWMLRITAYADRLLDDLELVDWPEHVKQMQRHWIGRRERDDGTVEYRLRDWLFSRQRYWGEPIPVVHTDDGEIVPLAADDLPVELPEIDEHRPTDDGRPPLARAGDDWLRVTLPDGRRATRETNTMPQWAGSCWYYLRFLDPSNERQLVAPEIERYWMPVDLYVGGVEHAVLHLLYARFWHKVLYDCGVVSTPEPFQRLYNQGMVHYDACRDDQGRYHHRDDVEERGGRFFADGRELTVRLEKMSKSKLNVVNPDDVVARYGADALRLYVLFMGPLDQSNVWQTDGVEGTFRFLQRAWRLVVDEDTGGLHPGLTEAPAASEPELERALHRTVKKVLHGVETMAFNTAVAQMMVFVNEATRAATLPRAIVRAFVRVLAPFAPHLAEELWHRLGEDGLVACAPWPEHDETLCADDEVTVIVQVDGKKRDELRVAREAGRAELERRALGSERVRELLGGQEPRRVVVVPGRLVNVVTGRGQALDVARP